MDYIPLIISLASAFVGVRGFTWNTERSGWKAITFWGYAVILFAAGSFLFSIYTLKIKNKQIEDTETIRQIANRQILRGLKFISSPLASGIPAKDSSALFTEMLDTVHLSQIFNKRVVDILELSQSKYDQPFQRDSVAIHKGEDILNDAIIKYNSLLDAQTIIYINDILEDDFYNQHYTLRNYTMFYDVAWEHFRNNKLTLQQRWNATFIFFRFYYSESDKKLKTLGDYSGITILINKFSHLYTHIRSNKFRSRN